MSNGPVSNSAYRMAMSSGNPKHVEWGVSACPCLIAPYGRAITLIIRVIRVMEKQIRVISVTPLPEIYRFA